MDKPFDKYFYDFTEEQRARLEKALRKMDGKKRLIKTNRKGTILDHLLYSNWEVDTEDILYRYFEDKVRKNLNYWFYMDERALAYVYRYGWGNSSGLIWCWFEKNSKWIIRMTLNQLKNGG